MTRLNYSGRGRRGGGGRGGGRGGFVSASSALRGGRQAGRGSVHRPGHWNGSFHRPSSSSSSSRHPPLSVSSASLNKTWVRPKQTTTTTADNEDASRVGTTGNNNSKTTSTTTRIRAIMETMNAMNANEGRNDSTVESSTSTSKTTISNDIQSESASSSAVPSHDNNVKTCIVSPPPHATKAMNQMMKRGPNQLVLRPSQHTHSDIDKSSDNTPTTTNVATATATAQPSDSKAYHGPNNLYEKSKLLPTEFTTVTNSDNSTVATQSQLQSTLPHKELMKRLGRNKLVLRHDDPSENNNFDNEGQKVETVRGDEGGSDRHKRGSDHDVSCLPGKFALDSTKVREMRYGSVVGSELKKVGSNKLVKSDASVNMSDRRHALVAATRKSNKRPFPRRGKAPERPPPPALGAKRIKLAIHQVDSNDSAECTKEADVEGDGGSPSKNAVPTEKLSDFAYRETNKVKQYIGNKTWAANGTTTTHRSSGTTNPASSRPKSRSMGLVRVKSDKTPVCPTFLKGLDCFDAHCTKRHDIPREFAMPICSFFQRHGQCLKEDCKFRHIKVNPRATVCPTFELLGYCEDPACVMKHVRVRQDRQGLRKAT